MTNVCYIIGNGPSQNRVPAEVIEKGMTFGMNYCGFQPQYYVCVDQDIIVHHPDDIRSFIGNSRLAFLSGLLNDVNSLYEFGNIILIEKDTKAFKPEKFMSGLTAAYVALKCAYYAGYDEVHLFGLDHDAAWTHYRSDYRIGKKTNAMHMSIMEWHYQLAANVYARAGRQIWNHSNPSKLDAIFRRAS